MHYRTTLLTLRLKRGKTMNINHNKFSKEHHPLISIIIPIYKQEKYLRDCVDSVIKQTYNNIEIILVDDGSPDTCPAICDEYKAQDKRVIVLHKSNAGVSAARNSGIDIATGEWIVFVDSDDVISNIHIETLVNHICSSDILTCVGICNSLDGMTIGDNNFNSIDIFTFKNYISLHGGFPVCALYNNKIIKKHNLRFNESISYVEDVLWNYNYFCYVKKAVFISDKLYFYRKHPDATTNRCKDKKWVVSSWFNVRNIGIDWYFENNNNEKSLNTLKNFFRLCTNNIISESIKAKFSFFEYNSIRNSSFKIENEKKLIVTLGIEYFIQKYFPRLYLYAYKLIYKILK